ncbi:PREDICTED: palmitoyltransferase ZDHHC13 [Nanorana parkeri]|uniref:palmitoyltransferase ZDHHC13 n=1 Tax=Nanorana parkeri TaxID=125878 RepID=UPI000853FF02|nr:PREDICTED: palmitoyltransferase ZDHHC13 [Nanorana parkeri]
MSSPCKQPHGHSHQHGHSHHGGQHGGPREDQEALNPPVLEDYSNWDIVKATQHGLLDRCRELVEADYDVRQPDGENVTLLHWAAINNRLELVKYFISKGAVVDQLGGTLNSTPLHWAVRQGHLQAVILLIKYGADPSLIDGEGYNSVHLAVLFQHLPIIAYLIAKGLNIDSSDMNGMTPLMLSAQKVIGMEPTSFLLKMNPSVNLADKVHRNTALHWAVSSGNVNAVDLLLEAGASMDITNEKGETPLDLARQTRNRLILHILTGEASARASRNSRTLKALQKYEMLFVGLICLSLLGGVGYILNMKTDSWLLKGTLFALVTIGSQFFTRRFVGHNTQKHLPPIFFISSVFWMFMTWFICFLPDLAQATVQIPFVISMFLLLYYFYKTWRTDPGYIKSTEEEKRQTIITLAEAGCLDARLFCTSCLEKKPLRSMHCHSCNSCVAKYDQHCIWTGHCIGAGNHHYFVLFLCAMMFVGHWMIYASSIFWVSQCSTSIRKDGVWGFLSEIVTCSPWVLYIFLLVSSLTVWATLMFLMQIYQIAFLGLTTQERFSFQMQNRFSKHKVSMRRSPFNHGCIQNLADFFQCQCFGMIKVTPVDWTKQFHSIFHPSKMRNPQHV